MRIPWNRIERDILHGSTPTEVAERYNVSVNTVKSRIHRNKLLEKRKLSDETGNLVSIMDKVKSGKSNGKELIVLENSVTTISKMIPTLISEDKRLSVTRSCNRCNISKNCTYYEEDRECSISNPIKADTSEDLINIVQNMISLEADRILQAITEEKRGGTIGFNLDLSEAVFNFLKMIKIVRDMSNNNDEIYISAKGPGILHRLFGNKE